MYYTGLVVDVFRGILRLPIRTRVVTHVFLTSVFHSRFHIILLRLFLCRLARCTVDSWRLEHSLFIRVTLLANPHNRSTIRACLRDQIKPQPLSRWRTKSQTFPVTDPASIRGDKSATHSLDLNTRRPSTLNLDDTSIQLKPAFTTTCSHLGLGALRARDTEVVNEGGLGVGVV